MNNNIFFLEDDKFEAAIQHQTAMEDMDLLEEFDASFSQSIADDNLDLALIIE